MASEKRPSSFYLDLKNLRERFEEVDKDGKGFIDYEELQVMIASMEEFDPAMARELMDYLDRDKDGKVTFEDFQILYTVERDVIKEHRPAEDLTLSPSPSVGFSTRKAHCSNSSKKYTIPSPINPSLFTRVPDSPDLASHARSLRGSIYRPDSTNHSYQDYELGDVILEDTGGVSMTYGVGSPLTSPKSHSFYGDIRTELRSICPTGVVEREHVMKLSSTLGLDAIDEQELIDTWEECDGEVTVNSICRLLQEKEKVTLIDSIPTQPDTRDAWQQPSSLSSPLLLKESPNSSTPYKKLDEMEEVDSIDGEDEGGYDSDWLNGTNYSFTDMHHKRPSSAKEGSRLSRGYRENSLRQTAMMHNEYRTLQGRLVQVTSENESLKANMIRIEEEKKNLIVEGEEIIQQFHKRKQDELHEMKDGYSTKVKEIEKSFTNEHQSIQERTDHEVIALKERLTKLKNKNKALTEDVEYFQNDNEKLVVELQKMRSEIKEKEIRIARLHETFGIQMESPSDTDLEIQAIRIQDLEKDLNDYTQLSEDLRAQNRELKDKVDELTEECEELKMKVIEEKRKRQRHKSSVTSLPSIKTSTCKVSSKSHRRELPHVWKQSSEKFCGANELSSKEGNEDNSVMQESSEESDEFEAASSASLLEEMKLEDNRQLHSKKISELEKQNSLLEESYKSLKEENELLFQSNGQLIRECDQLRRKFEQLDKNLVALQFQFAQAKQEREEMESVYALQMENMQTNILSCDELNEALKQENLDLHSSHLLFQNDTYLLEEKCEELTSEIGRCETKMYSLEHELKMKQNETGLAIHDLTKKEDDYIELQEKVQKLEKELLRLHANENDTLSQMSWFEMQLHAIEKDKCELEERLLQREVERLSPAPLAQEPLSPVKGEEQREGATSRAGDNSFIYPTSPFVFSPNRSFTSSTGQSEIVSQMKMQLENLERVLVQKGGQDASDTEMTVIQELLHMNTALEENTTSQQIWYDSELSARDELIEDLQKLLQFLKSYITESCNTMMYHSTQNLQVVPDLIQAMSERISSLLADVQTRMEESYHQKVDDKNRLREGELREDFEKQRLSQNLERMREELKVSWQSVRSLQGSLEMTEHDLNESEKKRLKLEEIITRQKNELELVNHYLGKAKSLELQNDKEKEENERQLLEKERDLHTKHIEILQLQEKVKTFHEIPVSLLRRHSDDEVDGPDEQNMADLAEEDIDLLRSGLHQQVGVSLVKEVRGEFERMKTEMNTHRRSTETAEDLIGQMCDEVCQLYQETLGASDKPEYLIMVDCIRETIKNLKSKLSTERALLKESREELIRKTEEYELLYSEHDEEVRSLEQQSRLTEEHLVQTFTSKDKEMYEEMERLQENNTMLEGALHKSLTAITTLHTEKTILIETIHTLSLQTIRSLNTFQ